MSPQVAQDGSANQRPGSILSAPTASPSSSATDAAAGSRRTRSSRSTSGRPPRARSRISARYLEIWRMGMTRSSPRSSRRGPRRTQTTSGRSGTASCSRWPLTTPISLRLVGHDSPLDTHTPMLTTPQTTTPPSQRPEPQPSSGRASPSTVSGGQRPSP